MLLAIDIGNTNIVIGLLKKNELIFNARLSTSGQKTIDEYKILLKYLFIEAKIQTKNIHHTVISSVVPELNYKFTKLIKNYLNITPFFITNKIKLNIKLNYDNPEEIGADRIVNAAAAFNIHKKALIVLDFGTATTIEYITEKGEYTGGLIMPGLNLMKDALHLKTAKLPEVNIQEADSVLGLNTINSIQNGLYYLTAGGIRYIIEKIKKEKQSRPLVLATGGLANLLEKEIALFDVIDQTLTLKGLNFLYWLNHDS